MLVDAVSELSDLAHRPSVQAALGAMREQLGVDIAFVPFDGDADADAAVAVPLRFSDGRRFGTLRAADRRREMDERDLRYLRVVARIVADGLEREEVEHLARTLHAQAAAVTALRAAVAARDRYTGEHSDAVVEHAVAVGRLMGLDGDDLLAVTRIALLHDIGKIAIPDGILHKDGALTADEWVVMRGHPVASAELVAGVPALAHLAPGIRGEHERWDGAGYPDGIAGEEIPLGARITLVCDAFHAMISDRPYRPAMSQAAAVAEIEANVGTQFCPTAAGALLRLLREG